MARHPTRIGFLIAILFALLTTGTTACAEESRFAATHSRSQYVHWIDLYDADGAKIDPNADEAKPYSPVHTCGRCHDYASIAHGYHFSAPLSGHTDARSGEPWIWTDTRTGTQIPMSYREWAGTYHPRDVGISDREFVLKFGHHMPGGGVGATPPAVTEKSASEEADDTTSETTESANDEAPAED